MKYTYQISPAYEAAITTTLLKQLPAFITEGH